MRPGVNMTDLRQAFEIYYDAASWFYLIAPLVVFPILFVIDAPFGRFSPKNSKFAIDGVVGWMIMESVSPIVFIATYFLAPFSPDGKPPPLNHPSTLLAALFVLHYINRAIVSPLRSPGRSSTHIVVVFAAIIFNLVNPPLVAAFLSAPETLPNPFQSGSTKQSSGVLMPMQNLFNDFVSTLSQHHADHAHTNCWTHPTFIIGISLFVLGLASNIYHDEILYDIRRNAPPTSDGKHQYSIPQGCLYRFISYPNYFSEWIEFIGFAIAASPRLEYTPPWMFVVAEIMVMLPRAYKGHEWYHQKFPDYPKDRKAIIPFVL